MKKNLLIALIAAAGIGPFAAQAQSDFGVNLGSSDQKLSVDGGGSESDRANGFRVYAGSAFTKNFGIEGGFVKHGSIEVDLGDGNVAYSRPKTFYVAGTGTIPLSPRFSLLGKLGVGFNRTDFGYNDMSVLHRETAPFIGVGASFAFTPEVQGVVEYEHYGKLFKDDGVKIEGSMISVGVRFGF